MVPVEGVRPGGEAVSDTEIVDGEVREDAIEADLPDEGCRELN